MTQITDIKNSIITRLIAVLPSDYKALAYIEEIEKNNNTQIKRAYGVQALEAEEVSGVNKVYTIDQTFEVIITDNYNHSQVNDNDYQNKTYDIREQCLAIYKDIVNTHAGLPGTVLNVSSLFIDIPEQDDESKSVIQRINFLIRYRVSLI